MNIYEKLNKIQTELKAPKGQYNSFGKYKYRSCEDILESVKPLLEKYKATLQLTDTIELIGERYYIKAVARFIDIETPLLYDDEITVENVIVNSAYAREDLDKKGMDGSQITGTASSYARKYALNGLFLIDDTKDADTDEYKKQNEKLITKDQIKKINELVEDIDAMLNYYKLSKLEEMPYELANKVIDRKENAIK
jgi:hypothetical protein